MARIMVDTRAQAFARAAEIFGGEYQCSAELSDRAGYPVYAATDENRPYDTICDLNTRLEVNVNGKSVNVWYGDTAADWTTAAAARAADRKIKAATARTTAADTAATADRDTDNGNDNSTFADVLHNYCALDVKATKSGTAADRAAADNALYAVATATTYCVLNVCLDPQRKGATADRKRAMDAWSTAKTAADRKRAAELDKKAAAAMERVSDNGCSEYIRALKSGVAHDTAYLRNLAATADRERELHFDGNGNLTETIDKAAAAAMAKLIDCTLSDGLDIVHSAVVCILEQRQKAIDGGYFGECWLEHVYTCRRLSKRVHVRKLDSKAYKDVDTTAIQEIFRAVRQAIINSRSVRTDVRNKCMYIQELCAIDENGVRAVELDNGNVSDVENAVVDAVYIRGGVYADIGGMVNNDAQMCVTDKQTMERMQELIGRLNLTEKQMQVLRLRFRGYGYAAIATYNGTSKNAVVKTVQQMQTKAILCGLADRAAMTAAAEYATAADRAAKAAATAKAADGTAAAAELTAAADVARAQAAAAWKKAAATAKAAKAKAAATADRTADTAADVTATADRAALERKYTAAMVTAARAKVNARADRAAAAAIFTAATADRAAAMDTAAAAELTARQWTTAAAADITAAMASGTAADWTTAAIMADYAAAARATATADRAAADRAAELAAAKMAAARAIMSATADRAAAAAKAADRAYMAIR